LYAARADLKLANGVLVRPGAFLDNRNGASNTAPYLEVAHQDYGVRQVGYVNRRLHISDKAMLSNREEGGDTLPVEVLQKLMHMQE
jgi:hypothetical protein